MTTTLVAEAGPAFESAMVYVMDSPAFYGPAAAVFVIATSAPDMATAATALLFAGFGSELLVVTVALSVTGLGTAGNVTVRAMVADPPFAIVPSVHVMVVVPLHVP